MVTPLKITLLKEVEEKQGVTYSVKFCSILPPYKNHFAAVGSKYASLYRLETGTGFLSLEQAYEDSDGGENFYSCTWADKGDRKPLLALAGKRGIIKVVSPLSLALDATLLGHGDEIMDITTHTVDHNLIFSCSKDESIRMWNIKQKVCIATFGGDKGHRNEVLSISVHPSGNMLASSGMDTTVKIWSLVSPEIEQAISKSYVHNDFSGNIMFVAVVEQYPIFSSDKIHRNYVDCTRWVGNLLLSKGVCNRAVLWTPDPMRAQDAVCVVKEFSLTYGEIWFVKMSISSLLYLFAVGNCNGELQLFQISSHQKDNPNAASKKFLSEIKKANKKYSYERFESGVQNKADVVLHRGNKTNWTIRDSDFNIDSEYLVYCAQNNREGILKSKLCIWRIESCGNAKAEHDDIGQKTGTL